MHNIYQSIEYFLEHKSRYINIVLTLGNMKKNPHQLMTQNKLRIKIFPKCYQ